MPENTQAQEVQELIDRLGADMTREDWRDFLGQISDDVAIKIEAFDEEEERFTEDDN